MKKFFSVAGVLTLISMLIIGCGEEKKVTVQSDTKTAVKSTIPYEIHSVEEDINTSYGTRYGGLTYQVYIVIKGRANVEQLKDICQKAVEEVKKTHKKQVNAVLIWPYDYPEYINSGLPLGQAVLLSDGSWKWELKEKDWSKQLTPDEVKIWTEWKKLRKEQIDAIINTDPLKNPDENVVTDEVAKKFGISAEKVNEILLKQAMWVSS